MTNNFTAYLLSSDGSATPVFQSLPASISMAGKLTLQGETKNILLAGGFSGLTPESPFPLSATLQLNGDLGNFPPDQLAAIGQAELRRHNSINFRSYTLDTDARLAVLAGDAGKLRDFVNVYGGLLNLGPLLLKGYEEGLTTAEDVDIQAIKNGYRIRFLVKSPIDQKKCTYCGACGPVCPEHCLSETLFLDFSRCSYCKECVNACPQEAIDLYGAEKRSLEVPALLLLEGAQTLDLPDNGEHIYNRENLESYFSSLFPCQIEEVVTCDNSLCQYSGRLALGCNRCSSACQHGAVTKGQDGISIDPLLCRECGACISSCPTGAIQYQRFSDLQFVEYFRIFRPDSATTVVIGDEKSLHRFWWHHSGQRFDHVFFLEYPTVKALTAMHLVYLFSVGAGKIILLAEEDAPDESPLAEQIRQTNQIVESLFDTENTVITLAWSELSSHLQTEVSHSLKRLNLNAGFQNRRAKLASTLQFLAEESGREASFTSKDFSTFGTLSCDQERCTQCLACLNECRMKALRGDENFYSLNHTASRCVQCDICVDVCPENALEGVPGLHLNPNFFADTVLSKGAPMQCKDCGKIFGTRKSFERVMAKLTAQNMAPGPDNLFEYCDTCRVIKIYESREKSANE
ncbi:MAG: 4Fe-4S binding protein [Desulfobulbaceae bacterium]|nr:4Fe-4S binding protein [Desulfobulbaceae bacterium]